MGRGRPSIWIAHYSLKYPKMLSVKSDVQVSKFFTNESIYRQIIRRNIEKRRRWKVTYIFTIDEVFTDESFYLQIIRRNIKKRLWWKVTNIFRKSRNFSPTKVFTDELAVEILKNFVGERWRTFSHMTKSFTDERFTNYSIENVTHPDRSFKYGSSRLTRF